MKPIQTLVTKLGALGLVWPDRVSAALALGQPMEPAQRAIWMKLLRSTFGTQAIKAGFAIFGRALTLAELAHISQDSVGWMARVTEGAGLAALLAPFVKTRQAPPANFQALRDSARGRGLTSAGWKWLCRQRPRAVAKLFAFGWTAEAIWWVNLLANAKSGSSIRAGWLESGRPYLQQSTFEWVASCDTSKDRLAASLMVERLFRLVPEEASAQHTAEFELVASAFQAGIRRPETRISVAPGKTWGAVLAAVRRGNDTREALAQALERNRALEQAVRAPAADEAWPSRIGSGLLHQVRVTELLSSQDLENEGAVMAHCVGNGGYLASCAAGRHVVLSLKEPVTNSRATLQLVYNEKGAAWLIGQLAGPANSAVPQVFWTVARSLSSGAVPVADSDLYTA